MNHMTPPWPGYTSYATAESKPSSINLSNLRFIRPNNDTLNGRKCDNSKQRFTYETGSMMKHTLLMLHTMSVLQINGKMAITCSQNKNTHGVLTWRRLQMRFACRSERRVWQIEGLQDVFVRYSSSRCEECRAFDGRRTEIESGGITWLGYSKQHTHSSMHTHKHGQNVAVVGWPWKPW